MKLELEKQFDKNGGAVVAADYLANFWATYNNQPDVDNYLLSTFLGDALYGIGVSINEKEFSEAKGYDKFKKILIEHLKNS